MRTLEELREFYRTHLRAGLAVLEQERTAVLKTVWMVCGAVAGLAVLAGAVFASAGFGEGLMWALILGAGGVAGAYSLVVRQYRSRFKEEVIAPLIRFFDGDLRYTAQGCVPQALYEAARIFPRSVDRYQGDDCVEGRLGQTDILFSELHTEYKTTTTDSRGRRQTQWHTIFKGLFFCADFNKHFSGRTVVLPDYAERMLGGLGRFFQSKNFARDPLVHMDDPDFERAFVVYASDPIEARYILSPSLMKRILDFKTQSGRPIWLAFAASRIFLAVGYQKNLFEPNVFKTLLDFSVVEEYFTDLKTALDIVGELNLNTRIWSKE